MTVAPGDGQRSAHVDTFARDRLPPRDAWPEMDYTQLRELAYPARLNCATMLLDDMANGAGGDRVAVRAPGLTWTYRELLERANRIAHVLVDDLGLVPGNRVLLRGPNAPMLAACWFAVIKAGGICVTTMPLLRVRELCQIADKAEVSLALTDTRVAVECEESMQKRAGGEARTGGRVVHYGSTRTDSLESMMQSKPTTFTNVDTSADDLAIIAFTSGTTGQAKGTMHFHRDIIASCDCFPKYVLRATPNDIFCGSPPLAFTFGLGGLLLFPMRIGASTLLLEQATPPHLLQGIQDAKATVVFTSPTAYRMMSGLVKDYDISSLRKCVSAGEHLPAATFERWRGATGIRIIDGIGSTEMLHIFISAVEDEAKPGSTGKTVPGYRAKIVDDEGNDVPLGTIGNLAVQGPTGCRYMDNIERQRAYVRDGWNYPGDSYRLDEDGYFWYQARTDDLIVSGGNKISGTEVENVLLDHPSVMEVGVVGVPDEERGQVVTAFIVLRQGFVASPALAKELQEFTKREIAPYKYPRVIEFLDKMPRTDTGKLQRYRLREQGLAKTTGTPS